MDLIEALRFAAVWSYAPGSRGKRCFAEAADEIERLTAERDAANEVIETVRDHFGNANSPYTPSALEALANYDSVREALANYDRVRGAS